MTTDNQPKPMTLQEVEAYFREMIAPMVSDRAQVHVINCFHKAVRKLPLGTPPCTVEYRVGDVVVRHEAPTVEELNALVIRIRKPEPERLTVTVDTKIVGPAIEQMAQEYFKTNERFA